MQTKENKPRTGFAIARKKNKLKKEDISSTLKVNQSKVRAILIFCT